MSKIYSVIFDTVGELSQSVTITAKSKREFGKIFRQKINSYVEFICKFALEPEQIYYKKDCYLFPIAYAGDLEHSIIIFKKILKKMKNKEIFDQLIKLNSVCDGSMKDISSIIEDIVMKKINLHRSSDFITRLKYIVDKD